MTGRLLLVDAASQYFRAFYGVKSAARATDGTPVNAVRGFLDGLATVLLAFPAQRLVLCLDADWRPAFRTRAIPAYKAHRLAPAAHQPIGGTGPDVEDVPADLLPQVPVLLELCRAMGLAQIGVPGFEADDVIGTLAARDPGPVDVLTGDRDLFQVVDDDRGVRVLYTGRGLARLARVDDAWIREKYGVPASAYADYAILRGDPSDGLPGVKGVGERTAAALIERYGSLARLRAALATDGPVLPRRAALEAAEDYLDRAPVVVRVRTDVPVPKAMETSLASIPSDPERLVQLADRWEVRGPVNRVLDAVAQASSSP